MERTNKITVTGFISFPKNFGEDSTAKLSLPINRGTRDEPKWDYLNISVTANKSKIDFTEHNKKKLKISGYITGEAYTPKDSDKEITVMKIVAGAFEEIAKGEKVTNEVTLTSMSKFIREFGEKGVGGQLSVSFNVGSKESPEYKYVNIGLTGSRSKLSLKDGEIITVKGFIKADFFVPKGSEKEIALPVIVGMEILEREMPGTEVNDAPPPSTDEDASLEADTSEKSDTKIDVEDDEIPF